MQPLQKELFYRFIETYWGPMAILGKANLISATFLPSTFRTLQKRKLSFGRTNHCLIRRDDKLSDSLVDDLKSYFSGKKITFHVSFDFFGLSEFTLQVLMETKNIPYGQTRSYKEIARRIGNPKAFRAVANALSKNPFPILIPCHRVIQSDGSVGGFCGQRDNPLKVRLLRLENPCFYYRIS
jgi:O-6-methylguanine DNA methyltransferase